MLREILGGGGDTIIAHQSVVVVWQSLKGFQKLPGDLGTRKRPGTSCKIEIHFWFKITRYLINGIRFLFQICPSYSPLIENNIIQKHKIEKDLIYTGEQTQLLSVVENSVSCS